MRVTRVVLLSLACLSGVLSQDKQPVQDKRRSVAGAKIICMLAEKGEKLHAGPLTVLIDPATNATCKQVVVDPTSQALIPAVYRAPGEKKTSVFLIKPISGTGDRARYRQHGDELLVVVPDDLGARDIRKRTFWLTGEREGRAYVRQLSYYEIVAYTARDSFTVVSGPAATTWQNISYADEREPPTTVPLDGTRFPPPTVDPKKVNVGQWYTISCPVQLSENERFRLDVWSPKGTPAHQSKDVDASKGKDQLVTFDVQANSPGVVESTVTATELRKMGDAPQTLGIYDSAPIYQAEGKVGQVPEGFSSSDTGDGRTSLTQKWPYIAGGIGVALTFVPVIVTASDGTQHETAIPRVQYGDQTLDQIAMVRVTLADGSFDPSAPETQDCPPTVKVCICGNRCNFCGCTPKAIPCNQEYPNCSPKKASVPCECGGPKCGCPRKDVDVCSTAGTGSVNYRPCSPCDPKNCVHKANVGCTQGKVKKIIKRVLSVAGCLGAGIAIGSVKPGLGTFLGAIIGTFVCAVADIVVLEEVFVDVCQNNGTICANPGHSKCGCSCSITVACAGSCGHPDCACDLKCGCGK